MANKINRSQAIARIVSDMIKADNIIEKAEIDKLIEYEELYKFDLKTLEKARAFNFSECVEFLKNDSQKSGIFEKLKQMAKADGSCVPKEALLLLSMHYCWNSNNCQLVSCIAEHEFTNSNYVIYIEGNYNELSNDFIQNNLELISLQLQQCGFDFIYIPELVRSMKSMEEKYVKNVLGYMVPEIEETERENAYKLFSNLNTAKFCNEVLANSLHIDGLLNSEPSLLIYIGNSSIYKSNSTARNTKGKVIKGLEHYMEFLKINISDPVQTEIKKFIIEYRKLVTVPTVPYFSFIDPSTNHFKYFGFYKAIFDYLIQNPRVCKLKIDSNTMSFSFTDIETNEEICHFFMKGQSPAVFSLIIYYSLFESKKGLSTKKKSVDTKLLFLEFYKKNCNEKDKEVIEEVEKLSELDRHLRVNKELVSKVDSFFPKNIRPVVRRIKEELLVWKGKVKNIEDFIPSVSDGYYSIPATLEKVSGLDLPKI